jgi:hypothetical protein
MMEMTEKDYMRCDEDIIGYDGIIRQINSKKEFNIQYSLYNK